MAKRVQRRRGTTAEHATFTGYDGETTVDTSKDTVVVHDGTAAGGFPLAREDMSNVINQVGVTQLKLTDGLVGQAIVTDGSGTISFGTIDIAGATVGALGGDIEGTIANALIRDNKVGIAEINVTDGTSGQALITDGSGTLSFGDVLTDPALGGHLSGTTSAAVINDDTITAGMLTTALKNFTYDEFTGNGVVTTYTLTDAVGSVNAILAYIDGIVQPTSAYALPTTTSIQFLTAPPSGSIIRCLHLGFQSTVGVPSDGTVTNPKLANNAVTSVKILDGTIATGDIADDAITEAKIAAQTITNASIDPGTIRSQEIENLSIVGTDIAANSIDGTKIQLGSEISGDIMNYDGTNWVPTSSTSGTRLVADGAIPNGVPVILKPTGKVSVVENVIATPSTQYSTGTNTTGYSAHLAMDPNNADKFVVVWDDDTTNQGKACVGTIDRTAAALDLAKTVTVAGGKFVMDGVSQGALSWHEGKTYTFDVSDSTNTGHVLAFATAADAAGSTEYITQVTRSGTPGTASSTVTIVAPSATTGLGATAFTTLYYYCTVHTTMGAAITNIPMFTFGTTAVFYTGHMWSHGNGGVTYVPSSHANFTGKGVITGEKSTTNTDPFRGSAIQFQVANNGAGTTLTFSTFVTYSGSRSGKNLVAMDPHNAGKGMVAFQNNSNNYAGTLYQFTVTGGSGIQGWGSTSSHVFHSNPNPVIDAFQYDPQVAGRGIITFGTGNSGTIRVFTVNGTGDAVSTGASQFPPSGHTMLGRGLYARFDPNTANTNKIIFVSDTAASGNSILGSMATVSGTTLTFGAEYELQNSGYSQGTANFHPSNNGVFTISSHEYTSGWRCLSTGSVSGDVITFNGDYKVWANDGGVSTSPFPAVHYDITDPTQYIFNGSKDTATETCNVMYGPIGSNMHSSSTLTTDNWLGLSNGAYVDGANATIDIVGSNDDQSGLTIGEQYYVQTDGTLSLIADTPNVAAGKALTATKIFIRG